MAEDAQISEAEWQVMDVVWKKAPIGAAEVIAELEAATGWRPTTVKTLLARLVKKKFLNYKKDGNRFLYRPKTKREDCLRQASTTFVERFFGGEPLPMVLHFVEQGKLAKSDIQELRRMLDEAEARND